MLIRHASFRHVVDPSSRQKSFYSFNKVIILIQTFREIARVLMSFATQQ